MLTAPRSQVQCYGIAVLSVVIATLLMWLLDPWIRMTQSPFLLYFGAVMVSAWYGGTKPGLVTTVLSALISTYLFVVPVHTWLLDLPDAVRLELFVLECVLISVLCGVMHRARRNAESNWRSLQASETSLRTANTQISNILESITDGFFALDQQWCFTYVNQRCEEVLGRSAKRISPRASARDELLGQTIWQIFPQAVGTTTQEKFQQAVNTQEPVFFEIYAFPESPSYFAVRAYPLVEGLAVYFQDITAQRLAALQQQEFELRFRQLAENIHEFFWISDLEETEMLYVSPAYESTWGRSCQSLYEQPQSWFEAVHPDDQERVKNSFTRTRRDYNFNEDYRIIRPDGEIRWIWARTFPIYDETGQVYRIAGLAEDITRRKQIEDALRESERRFRRLIESNLFGVAFANFSGTIHYANDYFLRMLGYREADLKTGALSWKQLTPPEFLYLDERATEELKQAGVATPYEKVYIRKDGSRVPILIGCAMLDEPYAQTQEMSGFFLDITELKQAEEALRESEERFRQLAENIDDVFWISDPAKGQVIYVSPAYEQVWGRSRQGLYENYREWIDAIHPEERDRVQTSLFTKVYAGQYDEEYRVVRPDGSVRWVRDRGFPLKDKSGQIYRVAGVAEDITERKQAETALQQYSARLTLALDAAQMGSWDWNMQSNEVVWTPYHEIILGYEPGTSKRTYEEWVDRVHPEDLPRVEFALQKSLTQQQDYKCEYRLIWPDGSLHWVSAFGRYLYNLEGQPIRMVGMLFDVTERKQAEIALQERARQLTTLNEALASATTLLQKRNQELDQFAYIVSHDLKAPLRAIANLSQWIEEDLEGQLPEENQQQMQLLRERVYRMDNLINGLLEYSRVGRVESTIETVNVSELLSEVIDSLAPPASFRIEIEPVMPTLTTEKLPLSQVFANLISNAINHHPRTEGHIKISAQDQGNYYQFTVADDGQGIAPEDYERIFKIFQTLKASDKKESTGIGLAIVKKIVERQGGTVNLESQINQGTTFRFTWPKSP